MIATNISGNVRAALCITFLKTPPNWAAEQGNTSASAIYTPAKRIWSVIDGVAFSELLDRCAPSAPGRELTAIVRQASGFEPHVIGTGGRKSVSIQAGSKAEAITLATELMVGGQRIRIGLAQIDSSDLKRLGVSLTDAFEPCGNLKAAAQLLKEDPKALTPGRGSVERRRSASVQPEEGGRKPDRSRNEPGDVRAAWNVYGQDRIPSVFVYAPKD